MTVYDSLYARRSTRAFLSTPVEKDKLNAVLEAAARTPSWANSQPWDVFVATGETLERIRKAYDEKYANKTEAKPETPRPSTWPDSSIKNRDMLHADMERDCGDAVKQFGALNRAMFHAPAVIYICMDKILTEWSLYDIGAYTQSIMLYADELGLATIPAITLMLYPDVLRRELKIPDHLKLTIGIAIGYADKDNKINNLVSSRKPFAETVRYLD